MMEKGKRDKLLADLCKTETERLRERRADLLTAGTMLCLARVLEKTGDEEGALTHYAVALDKLGVEGVGYDPQKAGTYMRLAHGLAEIEAERIKRLEILGTTYRVTGMLERGLAAGDITLEAVMVYQRAA